MGAKIKVDWSDKPQSQTRTMKKHICQHDLFLYSSFPKGAIFLAKRELEYYIFTMYKTNATTAFITSIDHRRTYLDQK